MSVVTRWEERKLLQRRFFLRWQQEYLDSLNKRTKNHTQKKNFKKGDVVLLLNERKTRLSRPIARVEQVMLSRDNQVRSVLLRLPSSHFPDNTQKKKHVSNKETKENNEARFVRRGIEQLCLLEAQLDEAENNSVLSANSDCPTSEQTLVELIDEESSTGSKMSIKDIRKTYDLRKITYHEKKTNIWVYCALSIVATISIVAVACKFKNRLPVRSIEQKRGAVNTYISMDTMESDTEMGYPKLGETVAQKSEAAKITTSS